MARYRTRTTKARTRKTGSGSYRRTSRSRARTGGRTRRSPQQTVRLVIEQVAASPAAASMPNGQMLTAAPLSKKAKF